LSEQMLHLFLIASMSILDHLPSAVANDFSLRRLLATGPRQKRIHGFR
jgi:hypothetical protein